MKRKLRGWIGVLLVLLLVAWGAVSLFGTSIFTDPKAALARQVYSAGHKALFMCAGVFVAGRDPANIRTEELAYASPMFNARGDAEPDLQANSAIGTALFGLIKRRAVYREGFGCTLLSPDSTDTEDSALVSVDVSKAPGDLAGIPWPDGDLLPDLFLPPEVDAARLNAVMDAVFDGRTYYDPDEAWMDDMKTTGVVIVYQGNIIAERYAEGWGPHTELRTYSAAKSLTNALAGIRVRQGGLDLDQPLRFPEWTAGDARQAITLRHYLNMSSGQECDGGAGASLPVYFDGGRNAAMAAALRPLVADPGTLWCYANFDSISVARAVRLSLSTVEDYLLFPHRELFAKIGMRNTQPETDVFNNFIMSSQIWTTPRDLARFGLLYLNDGVWNGERILPEGWVSFTRTPAPALEGEVARPEVRYGGQFWLYDSYEGVPPDTFTAAGHGGQFATVVPSRQLVITRMGLQSGDYPAFIADVVAAITHEKEDARP